MTGVVLRCPSCGTTQAHVGECDACYEAQVRYFCDNHTPGLWLDQPQCKTCGARYGDAPRKRAPPAAVAPAPAAPDRAPSTMPGARARGRTRDATSAHARRGSVEPPAGHSKRAPDPDDSRVPPDVAELIHRVLGGRAHDGYGDEAWRRATTVPRVRLGGCLRRLVLLVFIVITLIVMGSFALLGGALQFFSGY